jgi:SAM-dependent methyltransferase
MSAACAGCGERSAVELFRRPPQHDPTGRPFAIVRCERCGVERLDPLPTEAELDEAYAAAYYEDRSPDTGASGVLRRIAWRAEVRPLMPLLSRGVRVLELGCGTGSFLAQLRQWFDVDATGQERSAAAAEEARRRGIRVIEKALADADLPAKAFDVVIMRHVLEHVPDPRGLLATARRVIADGGALLVTVPVTGGWDQRAFGPSWDGYEIPEHLWLFPRGVLTRLFHDAGFTVQERRESFVPNPWVNGTQRVLERRGAQRLARFFTLRNPISLVIGAPVGVAAGLLGRSGRLTVVARPVAT